MEKEGIFNNLMKRSIFSVTALDVEKELILININAHMEREQIF